MNNILVSWKNSKKKYLRGYIIGYVSIKEDVLAIILDEEQKIIKVRIDRLMGLSPKI